MPISMFRTRAVSLTACLAASLGFVQGQRHVAVPTEGLRITTGQGTAIDPCIISLDWSKPQPGVTRAVIIFHGKGRNVESYYRSLLEAARSGGASARNSVFIAPQFLDDGDIGPGATRDFLRWRGTEWESGAPALAPLPISPFDIVDLLLQRLSDQATFPNLKTVVLAGHSGGAQLLQRYAVVGKALGTIREANFHVRFVIANPSSYLYFSDERPAASDTPACSKFNHWKYGPINPPSYVRADAAGGWADLEAAYAKRDVIYLLGTSDTDPHEQDLDVSCAGEAQGATRFERGKVYYTYLRSRHSADWNQRLWFVPHVAHSAREMFDSRCGVSALFDAGSCADQ